MSFTRPRVFISYARRDGETFATALRTRIEREHPDITLWQDRARLEGGVGWWRQITDAIDMVEFVVLVMTPAALASPIISKEWRYARLRGVCVYPVKGVDDAEIGYAAIPKWMAKSHFFDLAREWDTFIHHLRSPCHTTRVPFMAPDLSPSFVERSLPMQQLLAGLIEPGSGNPIATTMALRGAGGLGKTTLAAALCHHDEVVTAFDDGILWVTLGQKPNLLEALVKLYTALTGERIGFVDTDDASFHLAERLEDKTCLLVIDDVWEWDHLQPFLRGGAGCARLITTRNFEIAAEAARVDVDEMTPREAVRLLTARLDVEPDSARACRDLAHRLGEWPLLLELANASLRQRVERGDTVERALEYVTEKFEQQGVTAFDQRNAQARSRALTRTLELSLNQLNEAERERYETLAIFPEDVDIPIAQASLVWGGSDFAAEEMLQRFDDLSLLRLDLHTATFYVHDVLRAYVLANLSDVRPAHRRLTDAWPDPYRLPDGYAWRWLAYHLVESGQADRLRSLLLDFAWLAAKLQATDPTALLVDIQYASADGVVRTLEAAVRLAAHILARDKSQLASQLLGRLPADGSAELRTLRESAARWRGGPWLRPLEPTLAAPGDALLFTLTGHTAAVRDVVMLADGGKAASASNDLTIRIWDLVSGVEERCFTGHRDWIRAVAASGDGRFVASAGDDQTIRVWDLERGSEHATIAVHGDWLRTLAIDREGANVVAGGDGRTITMFRVADGLPVCVLTGHSGAINVVLLTRDGRRLVSASDDRTVRVWDLGTGRELQVFRGHTANVVAIALAPDERSVASLSRDDTIRCWPLDPLEEAAGDLQGRVIATQACSSRSLALVDDGRAAIVGGEDASLTVWDVATCVRIRRYEGHTDWVSALAVAPGGQRVISASNDGTLKVWSLCSPERSERHKGHSDRVRAIVTTADGRLAVSTGNDHLPRVWDLTTYGEQQIIRGQSHWPVALTTSGVRFVVAASDATLNVVEVASGERLQVLTGHTDRVRAVVLTPDGATAVSAADDGTIRLWSMNDGRAGLVIPTASHRVRALAMTPDGRHVVSASDDRTLKMWDLATGAAVRVFGRHDARVNAVVITADGFVLSGSDDATICVWRLEDAFLVKTLRGHTAGINALALCPADRTFVTASNDFTVRLWRRDADEALCTYSGETAMTACAAGVDGLIIAGDQRGRVHFLHSELDVMPVERQAIV